MILIATTTISLSIQTLAHALGWTLLHFLWQGTLIAMVLARVCSLCSAIAHRSRAISRPVALCS
jgi:hypothetical protein